MRPLVPTWHILRLSTGCGGSIQVAIPEIRGRATFLVRYLRCPEFVARFSRARWHTASVWRAASDEAHRAPIGSLMGMGATPLQRAPRPRQETGHGMGGTIMSLSCR